MSKETVVSPVTGEIELQHSVTDAEIPERRHEVLGVVVLLVALFLLLSLVSYDGAAANEAAAISGSGNIMGLAGDWAAYVAFTMTGLTSYLLVGVLFLSGFRLFRTRALGGLSPHVILGIIMIVFFSAIGIHTAMRGEIVMDGHSAGGFLGELLGEILISLLSTAGTYLVALGGVLVVILLITDISLTLLARTVISSVVAAGLSTRAAFQKVIHAWNTAGPPWERSAETEPASPTQKNKPSKKPRKKKSKDDKESAAKDEKSTVVEDAGGSNVGAPGNAVEPKIVTNKKKNTGSKKKSKDDNTLEIDNAPVKGEYKLPSPLLLAEVKEENIPTMVDEEILKNTADQLVKILSDFSVFGEVREIHPGPVVTMFEFQPRSGTKLSKIENLSNEIAMALEVMRVRVVAPIPEKNAVGFELPNKKRETVYLREMITDDGFKNKKSKLPLSLGKDISGNPYFVDLAKMPHLLIAGTTGSGKSVSLNAMLLSLLYKYTPDDLRFLLVDPKMIELGIYDGIPHLLLPVVTDMSKACLALKWAVDEMERRYQLFADVSVRNLASYNKKIEKLKAEAVSEQQPAAGGTDSDTAHIVKNDEVVVVSSKGENIAKLEKLPFVVIVVDELADLMMVAAKDVETSIARLAQKARAAGLHLIIATQRPSVDVITGLIKANFPSRISFKVSSGHDSRTILGTHGAENLLGMGDMLIMPPGTSDLTRVHGAFVDDDEIHDIVNFLKSQGNPEYDEEILKPRDDEEGQGVDEADKDEVYDQAVAIVADAQVCSISMLQRRLRIGYNRSARIVEIMEREGVVGPANGVNKREVLISPI